MTTFKEYDSFDGLGLANLVQQGVISPKELLEAAIERIELLNPKLNAVIYKMYEQAYATIKSPLPKSQFQGVPFLLKDLLADYAGAPLSMGSRFTRGCVSSHDSELVKRYKKAGLVILGKTNVPEFGLGAVTEPEAFGPTRNPWNMTLTSGGSSGGSAVAVATRMVPMAHGGDGAGSLRIPAAYCGVFGFKPSRGRTPAGPRFQRLWLGMVTEHVITRTVRDSAAMLDISSGIDLGSSICLPVPSRTFLSSLEMRAPKLRIAMTERPFFSGQTLSEEYSQALKDAAQLCQQLGHQVDSVSLKINEEDVLRAFMIVMVAETTTDLNLIAQTIGKKINYHELEKLSAIVYRAGKCFNAADYAWAIQTLDSASKQLAQFFVDYDVLMTPTMIRPPSPIGHDKPDRFEQILIDIILKAPGGPWMREFVYRGTQRNFALIPYTPIFNVTGQPAMSVPLSWDKNGLPIGIQFAGRVGEDAGLLQLAQQLENAQPWIKKKPACLVMSESSKVAVMPARSTLA
jgi:amidase